MVFAQQMNELASYISEVDRILSDAWPGLGTGVSVVPILWRL